MSVWDEIGPLVLCLSFCFCADNTPFCLFLWVTILLVTENGLYWMKSRGIFKVAATSIADGCCETRDSYCLGVPVNSFAEAFNIGESIVFTPSFPDTIWPAQTPSKWINPVPATNHVQVQVTIYIYIYLSYKFHLPNQLLQIISHNSEFGPHCFISK